MAGLFADRYRLEHLLGTGGMAEVRAAHDERLSRTVALKRVPAAGLTLTARERFVREARATARFTHPNAVTLFDAGEAGGYLYLAMELVTGETLAERIAVGPLDPTAAARVAWQVLAALDAAHAVGIVHRDVKPANIMLDGAGNVKLLDFGIARTLDDALGDLTATGQHIGTPKYFAPEVLGGAPATPSSDVYAVGVVLYEMLTGRAPFDAGTPIATAMAHVNEPTPDVQAARPDVPSRLAAVVATAMAKDPGDRYPSAAAMRRVLDPVLEPARGGSGPPAAPTQLMTGAGPQGFRRSRGSRVWLALTIAAVAVAAVAAVAIVRDGDESAAPTTSVAPPAATTVPASASTLSPTTAVPPAAGVGDTAPAVPGSVDELIALFTAEPARFGSRAGDVVALLDKIGRGRKAAERAQDLLIQAAAWVDEGTLDPSALDLLAPVVEPIADGPGGGNGDDEDGNGNGNGNDED